MGDLTLSTFPMAGSRPSPTTPTTSLATLLRLPTLVSLSTPLPLLVATLLLPLSTLSTPLPTQLFTTPLFLSTLPLSMPSTTDLPMVLLPTEALSTTDKHLRKAGCWSAKYLKDYLFELMLLSVKLYLNC